MTKAIKCLDHFVDVNKMVMELQDQAWRSLPQEIREHMKLDYISGSTEILSIGWVAALTTYFGRKNLQSYEQVPELLTIERARLQKWYQYLSLRGHRDATAVLFALFGRKCLHDNFKDSNFLTK